MITEYFDLKLKDGSIISFRAESSGGWIQNREEIFKSLEKHGKVIKEDQL